MLRLLSLLSAFRGIASVLDGKKTFGATTAAIVALVWSLVSPGSAPDTATIENAVERGERVVTIVKRDVMPEIIALAATVTALFGSLLASAKNERARTALGLLVKKPVTNADLKDPVGFVEQFLTPAKNVAEAVMGKLKTMGEMMGAMGAPPAPSSPPSAPATPATTAPENERTA